MYLKIWKCTYALKEIVENHRSLNGSMFMGFLDASKAFDRLKHALLFEKLIDRNVPGIRIMMYWYASQTMYVRWSGILSRGFHVANGVRQGGILSPYLFNVLGGCPFHGRVERDEIPTRESPPKQSGTR